MGTGFYLLFGAAWLAGMAYGLSAWRLLARVQRLKADGLASEAPDPLTNPLDVFGYLAWLLGGRYADLDDETATRWSGIARALFVVALPLLLAVLVVVFTQPGVLVQPT